eukprot:CAMPEP_0185816560 /NCGR_PEP_ID=MMETSP1322-20130828/17664_1 /TAXON_ID=265543 /ORGANISM="Minutocellus polymorphus, Strain RCC2270" /LENGTH=120 /DNA_ID=CAMNT_0028513513 /DNA_START=134 /DNA_END=496 /DNA_ORIENTATION=+
MAVANSTIFSIASTAGDGNRSLPEPGSTSTAASAHAAESGPNLAACRSTCPSCSYSRRPRLMEKAYFEYAGCRCFKDTYVQELPVASFLVQLPHAFQVGSSAGNCARSSLLGGILFDMYQ